MNPINSPPVSWLTVNCPLLMNGAACTTNGPNGSPTSGCCTHTLDFGECCINSIKTGIVTVTNTSPISTECRIQYTSAFQTVTVTPTQLTIPPNSSRPITIRVQARQSNPNYHKLIVLTNEQNPNNTISIFVRSTNIYDTHGVRYHSQFYDILNPFVGRTPYLPEGFQEVNGKIKYMMMDDDSLERKRGSARLDKQQSTESEPTPEPIAPVMDDSDLPPPTLDNLVEGDPYHSNSTSNTHSSATSPLPPTSPYLDKYASHTVSLPHSSSIPNLSGYQQQLHSQSTPNMLMLNSAPLSVPPPPISSRGNTDAQQLATTNNISRPDVPINLIPVGTLVCQHPIMRMIEIRNNTTALLTLKLSTSLDANRPGSLTDLEEMRIYVRNEACFQSPEQLSQLQELNDSQSAPIGSPGSDHSSTASSLTSPLASAMSASLTAFNTFPNTSPPPPVIHDTSDLSALPSSANFPPHVIDSWSRFMRTCIAGDHVALRSHFTDLATERAYVKRFILQRRDLETVLKERLLVQLHDAQATQPDLIESDGGRRTHLTLQPLEIKQVFIYFHLQSQLPTKPSAATSTTSPASSTITFLSKDFLKNKIIRLDEREIRMRDKQSALSIDIPKTPMATSSTLVQTALSAASSCIQQAALAEAVAVPDSTYTDTSTIAANSDIKPQIVPQLSSSPSDSATSLTEPGLKLFVQLVDYPNPEDFHPPPLPPLPPLDEPLIPLERPLTPINGRRPETPTHIAVASPAPPDSSSSPTFQTSYPSSLTSPPIRSLLFPAFLCRSSLEVAQKHINFGQLLNMNVHSKALVLSNLSEVPLLFMVKQTGSIASLDLTFPKGDIGVIPSSAESGYTDLPFLFKPSLAGAFLEPITILNVEDTTNTRVINVKAYLRKPVHFWIQNLDLEFRMCCAPIPQSLSEFPLQRESSQSVVHPILSSTQRIVVKNISLKPRTFKIQLVDWEKKLVKKLEAPTKSSLLVESMHPDGREPPVPLVDGSHVITYTPADCPPSLTLPCTPSLTLKLEDVSLGATLSLFEREEEEESLNHKLRIAIRKKKLDKVDKIRNRLAELRDMKLERHLSSASSFSSSDSTSSPNTHPDGVKAHNTEVHDSVDGLIFTLEPNAVQNVRATFTPRLHPPDESNASASTFDASASFIEFYTGILHVFETKNREIIREVKCSVAICSNVTTQQDYLTDRHKWINLPEDEEDELLGDDEEIEGHETEVESLLESPLVSNKNAAAASMNLTDTESQIGDSTTVTPQPPLPLPSNPPQSQPEPITVQQLSNSSTDLPSASRQDSDLVRAQSLTGTTTQPGTPLDGYQTTKTQFPTIDTTLDTFSPNLMGRCVSYGTDSANVSPAPPQLAESAVAPPILPLLPLVSNISFQHLAPTSLPPALLPVFLRGFAQQPNKSDQQQTRPNEPTQPLSSDSIVPTDQSSKQATILNSSDEPKCFESAVNPYVLTAIPSTGDDAALNEYPPPPPTSLLPPESPTVSRPSTPSSLPLPPFIPTSTSRRAARHRQLESILNPNHSNNSSTSGSGSTENDPSLHSTTGVPFPQFLSSPLSLPTVHIRHSSEESMDQLAL